MRRPTEIRLRRAFADVLTALLATTAGAMAIGATGCSGGSATTDPLGGGDGGGGGGGNADGGVTIPAGFTSFCNGGSGTERSFLQGLKASPAIDGAIMRNESAFTRLAAAGGGSVPPMDELGDAWTGTDGEQVGTLCATATNPSACRDKTSGFRILPTARAACVAQFPSSTYSPTECAASYILYTRGDAIGVARTKDEIKALIGTFDTVEEALWVAQASNLQVTCGPGFGGTMPDSGWRQTADGGWDLSLTEQNCGLESYQVVVHVDYAGNLSEVSRVDLHQQTGCAVAGRRPAGLRLDGPTGGRKNAVGEHFASMATLEAASVVAFRRLHRQLAAFGAPRALLERIRKAARDEIRHARATGALAKKYGVTPAAPELGECDASPSLFAIALENAREGCVRETYGALVAHLQMTRAGDADVRACMAAIADEETEHAALSWDIAAWIESQLDDTQRDHLADERRDAFTTLARDLAVPVDPRVARVSGVPVAADAVRMLEGLAPMMLAA
jgi:hypothetical protein